MVSRWTGRSNSKDLAKKIAEESETMMAATNGMEMEGNVFTFK